MNGVYNPLKWTRSDNLAEAISAESCRIVLETSPPDYVQKISRYLESSVGQSSQDPASKDSDSGDSLFITQKSVPAAVRSQRRRHSTLRSDPTSPRDREDSEDDEDPSFASHRENGPERRRNKCTLPKYSFPFLKERKWKPKSTQLFASQNTRLHNSGMGGFFKCVRELWQSHQRGDKLKSSLPTVDVDGEEISPLSEGEEERSDDEDIKVVERKCFVVSSSKAKCPQPWNTPQKRDDQVKQPRKRKGASKARQETSQGTKRKTLHKTAAKASISKVPSRRVRGQSGRKDQHIKSLRNIVAQMETPKTKRRLTRGSQGLPQIPPHLRGDADGDESGVKKKKERGAHGGKDKLPEAQHAATSEDVEVADAESSPAPQLSGELEVNKNNQMEKSPRDDNALGQEEERPVGEIPSIKQKKRRKNKPAGENSGQEDEGGHLVCDVRTEDGREEKKKRRRSEKRKEGEREEDVEQLSSGAVAEPLCADAAEIGRKKKKRKKEKSFVNTEEASNTTLDQSEEPESCLENTAASQETLDSGYMKSKKHKKKKSCHDASRAGEEEGRDVNVSDDAATLPGKKKKKKTGFSICDGIDTSPDKTQNATGDKDAELVTEKKKKKKLGEISSMNISADTVEQSHDSVSVREKKRTSSFLAADAEGKDQSSPPQSVAVSVGHSAADSAEMAGNLSVAKSNDGVRKKKRKRKTSAEDHEQDFDEPSETCRSDSQETANAGVKRKKKRRRGESEPVTPVERLESAADEAQAQIDEAAALKKKKKKMKNKMEENPPTFIENAESVISTSHKKKQLSKETADMASADEPGGLVLNHFKDKKMKKKNTGNISSEEKSLANCVESEPKKHNKKERNNPAAVPGFISSRPTLSETDSPSYVSDDVKRNKHIKAKRGLHNPSEELLTHC